MIMKDRDVSNTARAVRKLCCLKKLGRQKKETLKTCMLATQKRKRVILLKLTQNTFVIH